MREGLEEVKTSFPTEDQQCKTHLTALEGLRTILLGIILGIMIQAITTIEFMTIMDLHLMILLEIQAHFLMSTEKERIKSLFRLDELNQSWEIYLNL